MLDIEWKAEHAVRDDTLVQKLCWVLITILGDTPSIAASDASHLLSHFTPELQVDEDGIEDPITTFSDFLVRVQLSKLRSKYRDKSRIKYLIYWVRD